MVPGQPRTQVSGPMRGRLVKAKQFIARINFIGWVIGSEPCISLSEMTQRDKKVKKESKVKKVRRRCLSLENNYHNKNYLLLGRN